MLEGLQLVEFSLKSGYYFLKKYSPVTLIFQETEIKLNNFGKIKPLLSQSKFFRFLKLLKYLTVLKRRANPKIQISSNQFSTCYCYSYLELLANIVAYALF